MYLITDWIGGKELKEILNDWNYNIGNHCTLLVISKYDVESFNVICNHICAPIYKNNIDQRKWWKHSDTMDTPSVQNMWIPWDLSKFRIENRKLISSYAWWDILKSELSSNSFMILRQSSSLWESVITSTATGSPAAFFIACEKTLNQKSQKSREHLYFMAIT